MPKLFVGAPVDVPEEAYAHAGIGQDDPDRQHRPHVTFHFCGMDMEEKDVRALVPVWRDALDKLPEDQRKIVITTEYALFGKEQDVLVLKCQVSQQFEDAVNHARAVAAQTVPAMPESDFSFSPHVTLGKAAVLPPPTKDGATSFDTVTMDSIFFWGDGYELRAVLKDDGQIVVG